MKRLHVSLNVRNLEDSIAFYSTLFGAEPTVRKDDYAKWRLDDPSVNLSIIERGGLPGVGHLGLQAETLAELEQVTQRLSMAERPLMEEKDTACCYARSDKTWAADPQGVVWESFHTHDDHAVFGGPTQGLDDLAVAATSKVCCD